jgi:hypothetical protein
LTEEIDGDGRVDRDEVGLLSDDPWIVDIANRPQFECGVLVEELVETFAAQREGADRLGAIQLLGDTRDDPSLDEVHHTIEMSSV